MSKLDKEYQFGNNPNLINKVLAKQKELDKFRLDLYALSRKNIPTKKKFIKRLLKINSNSGKYFTEDEAKRFTAWLYMLKYEKDFDLLGSMLYIYSDKDIEDFCSQERIDFIKKVKVVRRLTK